MTEATDLFRLPQHGFGRDLPWDRVAHSARKTLLRLTAGEETKKQFPYEFGVGMMVEVSDGGLLRYRMAIANNSTEVSMPVSPGLHPYFHVPVERKPEISTNIPEFDPRGYDWASPLMFPGQEVVEIQIPGRGTLVMRPSSEFKQLVVWSEEGRPFACFEPWVGDVNSILRPDERLNIPPGGEASLSLDIQFFRE